MKKRIFSLLLILGGCQLFEDNTKDYDLAELDKLYERIISLSESKTCSNSSEWQFTSIGSKACGGPTGYVAYSTEINESEFLELVKQYTELQAEYNRQNKKASDCSFLSPPAKVFCENGKPVFQY
jgi:hypothetical protein